MDSKLRCLPGDAPVPAIYGEAVAGRSAQVRKVLEKLVGKINENTFDVAELLYEAKSNGYWRDWGYESLLDYAWKELSIRERRTLYLVRIITITRKLDIQRSEYEPAGITKLREITRLEPSTYYFNPETQKNELNKDWMLEAIRTASGYTAMDLKSIVDRRMGLIGDESMEWMPPYKVKKSVRELVIKPAQELARRILGSAGKDEDGMAIEYSRGAVEEVIHADFLVGNQGAYEPENEPKEPDIRPIDSD
jgi:hypothetical protein